MVLGDLEDLRPVTRPSTAELIAEQIRSAIVRGALGPGEQLGEAELAAHFQVSRGPLREAMQRLLSEGLLYSIRNRGIFVTELTFDDVVDIYRSRWVIEGGALDLVLDGRREQTWKALEPAIEEMRTAAEREDATGVSDGDRRFHEILVASADSPRLVRAARTLLVETRMCLGALQTTYPDLHVQVDEHVVLREAIRTADREEVRRLLDEHLHDTVTRLRERQNVDGVIASG
ncbi:transcriptional regulator, GntR family [Rhodococcus rhodochrous J3]|jgi:DNA-binding GntR family transcriptional regulator|uniref:GntR family transcriptional regulator n=6 Tax=Rhodococcus TaxID=1827 RepID=A0AA46WX99_RHORH|nr:MULTISPECIES: GntR family transcriptional regulator [Rhodococcus]KLL96956.1 GntR family transcriptional regulator [Rhodococcus sp. IITR03]AHD22579.1 GntR family transcriptional regulator [Rhodococcus pyridinivorans SB3094]AWZ23690.1 GntR family transcriptional regulator [Rhodococcus pyridinivorans]EHK85907.1 GntR family transcriptional regulator [Rhodococcus pyridinivorans AK37]KSZ56870.1 GntR family transcriptional regulator [Rhodococcus pyridinivorans KG-16]